jgi:hypothetical protein
MERWMDVQRLGQLFRWIGAVLLLGASASFMLEGWEAYGSELRYALFVLYVLGLAGIGILLGWWVREDKGARALVGLAVAGIPVVASQLGAMVHSLVSSENGSLPNAFLYDAGTATLIALNSLAFLLLVPIAYLGFSALLRSHATLLTAVYFVASSALLVPVRHGLPLAMLIVGTLALIACVDLETLAGTPQGQTPEGLASRLLLLLPAGIMLGRAAFYPQPPWFLGLTPFVIGLLWFAVMPRVITHQTMAARLQALTLIPIVVGWLRLTVDGVFISGAPLMTVWLPMALLLGGLSFHAVNGGSRYRTGAALLAAVTSVAQLVSQGTFGMASLALLVAIGLAWTGTWKQERVPFVTGVALALFAVGYQLSFAVALYRESPWIALAGMGLLILVTASYLEKQAVALFGRLMLLRNDMKAWH